MLLKSGTIFIAILSILLVILEKNLPVQPALTLEELPKSVQDWEQKGKYLDVFGHKMFVIQEGQISKDQDVVVFFHGFPTSSYDYAKPLKFLKEFFPNQQLVFFDHLGFGFSDKPQKDYEFTLHGKKTLFLIHVFFSRCFFYYQEFDFNIFSSSRSCRKCLGTFKTIEN